MDYIDKTLIKLRREYSKDEVVAALSHKLSDCEIEKGQLKSEVEYLTHELKIAKGNLLHLHKNTLAEKKEARLETRKDELHQAIIKENQKLKEQNKKLTILRDQLLSKVFGLERKLADLEG